jgi:uncharacterized membrane protein YbhN (UPF0104 family)
MAAGLAMGVHITPTAAFVLLATLGLAMALPSTPGFVGLFQFAAVAALTPFGIPRADAIAYIMVSQAITTAVMAILGAPGLLEYRGTPSPATDGPTMPHNP